MKWILNFFLSKRYHSRDWIGLWYELLKERGENDQIAFVRAQISSTGREENIQKRQFSHSDMDGTSSIPYYFREFGQSQEKPRKMDYIKSFSFWETFWLTIRNMKISPKNNSLWSNFDPEKKILDIFEYARLSLSKEATLKFEEYCLKTKTSQNAILIKVVSDKIIKLTNNQDQDQTWLFPVNLRGMVQKKNDDANHSSFIPIHYSVNTTIKDIQSQMRQELKSFKYLGYWWVHHISMLAPKSYLRKLSLKASNEKLWLGSFSNLGKWNSTKNYKPLSVNENPDGWFFATPGSKNFPVSMVIMTFDDQMNLSMRVHPAVSMAPLKEAQEILEKVKSEIIQMCN